MTTIPIKDSERGAALLTVLLLVSVIAVIAATRGSFSLSSIAIE